MCVYICVCIYIYIYIYILGTLGRNGGRQCICTAAASCTAASNFVLKKG